MMNLTYAQQDSNNTDQVSTMKHTKEKSFLSCILDGYMSMNILFTLLLVSSPKVHNNLKSFTGATDTSQTIYNF
jgi:hypothetical protein